MKNVSGTPFIANDYCKCLVREIKYVRVLKVGSISWKVLVMFYQKIGVKSPGTEMKWEYDFSLKLVLILESDKFPVLGEHWAPVMETLLYQGVVECMGCHLVVQLYPCLR